MANPISTHQAKTYADLRSASLEKHRTKTVSKKYNNFRTVKPGQFSLPHYTTLPRGCYLFLTLWPASFDDCDIVYPSKRDLFQEAQQMMPGCNHKGRCPDKNHKDMKKRAERQERAARFEGQCWDKGKGFSYFTLTRDGMDYEDDAWWDAESALNEAFAESLVVWENSPNAVLDEDGGVVWGLDRTVDFGALVEDAKVDKRLRPSNGRGLRDWTEVTCEWLVSPDYEFVDDEDAISEFELV
jgi:hypothetical protein